MRQDRLGSSDDAADVIAATTATWLRLAAGQPKSLNWTGKQVAETTLQTTDAAGTETVRLYSWCRRRTCSAMQAGRLHHEKWRDGDQDRVWDSINTPWCWRPRRSGASVRTPPTELVKQAGGPGSGPGLLEFFRSAQVDQQQRPEQDQSSSPISEVRISTPAKAASGQLAALGSRAKSFLQEATKDSDVEVWRRAKDCLQKIDQGSGRSKQRPPPPRLVARRKPDKAVEVLLIYLSSAEDRRHGGRRSPQLPSALLAMKDGKLESGAGRRP